MSEKEKGPVLAHSKSSRRPNEERRRASAELKRFGPNMPDVLNQGMALAKNRLTVLPQVLALRLVADVLLAKEAREKVGSGSGDLPATPPWMRKVSA
jgi:hypothetical protein